MRGGINIQMGVMGEGTFIADILCNNQLYIVWGGGTRYGLLLISFVVCFVTYMLGEEQTLNIQQTTKMQNIIKYISTYFSQQDRKHVNHKFIMILTMLCIHIHNMTISRKTASLLWARFWSEKVRCLLLYVVTFLEQILSLQHKQELVWRHNLFPHQYQHQPSKQWQKNCILNRRFTFLSKKFWINI